MCWVVEQDDHTLIASLSLSLDTLLHLAYIIIILPGLFTPSLGQGTLFPLLSDSPSAELS
jgi:hypothetical protein